MTDNKKSGIRLRHLQQHTQPEIKRDPSPNNINRKKIFERLPQRSQQPPTDQPLPNQKTQNNDYPTTKEFQQLIDTLKKKSMEIQLRDNMIKSLNREIDSLNKQLQIKDKHINKLLLEIERLQRVTLLAKEVSHNEQQVFESFRDPPQVTSFAAAQNYTVHNEANPQRKRLPTQSPTYQLKEQSSLTNINLKATASQQILSPFMALNSKKDESVFESQITVKNKDDRRTSTNKDKLPNAFPQSYPFKKKGQFDAWNGNNDRKVSTSAIVTKQLQKFDLFGQNDHKSQIRAGSNLQIENSRQFKFEDFDPNEFQDFGQNSY